MEETLTDCLVRVREDLKQLNKVREYLVTNAETEEHCSVTWRTIEAFNSILSVCSSQNTPETNALDTLLDSFYFLARNNTDSSVWENFGFELGLICVKILSAIERTDIFELLFCKLLSIISMICEHNSNVWKAAARQILNVLINKKLSVSYLEAVLKWYLCIIRNIKSHELYEFSLQNLHLLKTLSLLVQKVGDFDIQSDLIRLIFLHLSKDVKLMSGFFAPAEKKLFESFQFTDFEGDCRLYLNSLNASRRGCERKVYSISTLMVFLGGSYVEPPYGKGSVWVDANKDSERLSIKCGDAEPSGDRTVYFHFSEILNVVLENDNDGNRCVTIETKSLAGLHKEVRNNNICLMTENVEKAHEFVQFLGDAIREYKKKRKFRGKMSRTLDSLLIDRNNFRKEIQDIAITSSEKPNIDHILPDVLYLFEKVNPPTKNETPKKTFKAESQKLSPASFVESLNKHMGLDSPEKRKTFEDSVETVEFFRKSSPKKSHKLFQNPNQIFNILETKNPLNFIFDEDKENRQSNCMTLLSSNQNVTPTRETFTRDFRNQKNTEVKFSNTQSQEYFQKAFNVIKKKKPCLPKFKRNSKINENLKLESKKPKNVKTKPQAVSDPKGQPLEKESIARRCGLRNKSKEQKEIKKLDSQLVIETKEKTNQNKIRNYKTYERKRKPTQNKTDNFKSQTNQDRSEAKSLENQSEVRSEIPSLLDPNGYAYQRWCKPTTSERSNFWLKKLDAVRKSRTCSDVFDFSDESDSIVGKNKKKTRRVIHSKRKCKTVDETKQTSLREVKKILKNSSPIRAKSSSASRINSPLEVFESSPRTEAPPEVVPSPVMSKTPETVREDPDIEYESVPSSGDEGLIQTKKRELSQENSSAKNCVKKKLKATLPKHIIFSIRRRLKNTEEKDRHYTNEIIHAVNKATNHFFNYLQRKDGEKVLQYLKVAETVSLAFDTEIDELRIRENRIQRAILYYKAGCSVSDLTESLGTHFSRVRHALNEFREKKDVVQTIDRICERMSSLIDFEIVKSTKSEWTLKRNKLLKCASVLGINFKEG